VTSVKEKSSRDTGNKQVDMLRQTGWDAQELMRPSMQKKPRHKRVRAMMMLAGRAVYPLGYTIIIPPCHSLTFTLSARQRPPPPAAFEAAPRFGQDS